MNTLYGMRIIESVWLVQDGPPTKVRRTWRERLFTLPWRPLVASRTVIPQIPYQGAMRLDDNTIVMHPETLQKMRTALRES